MTNTSSNEGGIPQECWAWIDDRCEGRLLRFGGFGASDDEQNTIIYVRKDSEHTIGTDKYEKAINALKYIWQDSLSHDDAMAFAKIRLKELGELGEGESKKELI